MRETVIVNQKEQRRIRVLVEVVGGRMTVGQAAESMNLSVREAVLGVVACQPGSRGLIAECLMGRNDVAALAVYLASEEAEFMTGQVMNINGGAYM